MALDPTVAADISNIRQRLLESGALLSEQELRRHYDTFAARFGPQVLRHLDGADLLERMHNTSNRASLVYWLEFKNDEEMPACFGSIAGGSALKFGIYRRKETGAWMTGNPQAQTELPLDAAIAIAQKHRNQLVGGAEVLERFRTSGRADYATLQRELDEIAPDVGETAWGHKYFSLLFPEVLDDYHAVEYQRYHLIRMLQIPSEGRYLAANVFIDVARQLQMPVNHLTSALNERNGKPRRYYRIGTGTDEVRRSQWAGMRDGGYTAIGWRRIGELSLVEKKAEGKELIRQRIEQHYPNTPQAVGKAVSQVFRFVSHLESGDIVLAADGRAILGIGRIIGPYSYVPDAQFPHRRAVEWLSVGEWELPTSEGLRTTLHEMRKHPENLIEAERRLLAPSPALPPEIPGATRSGDQLAYPRPRPPLVPLSGVPQRIQAALDRKGQVILHGPPGTGKTYWAEATAFELAARSWFGKSHATLESGERAQLEQAVVMCTFHAAYGYEDFLEGFRPQERGGALFYEMRDGIFKRICIEARANPAKSFYLVIDEINRGDIPRIFGELLTLLEKSRRGQEITLAVSGERFSVPGNLFVIGTMNTADRSIALLDAALRRRFGFIELMPDDAVLADTTVSGIPLGPWLKALNERILTNVRRDARNLQVGHTYLMHEGRPVEDFGRLVQVLRDDVIPLLEEYCYEDYEALERILGPGLVHRDRRRINESVFRAGRETDLVQALLQPCPDITATPQAMVADAQRSPEPEEEDEDAEASGPGQA